MWCAQNCVRWLLRRSSNGVSVTLGEFEDVLRSMSMASLVPVAHRIFEHFDGDKNGSVDMREIVCGFSSLRKKGEEALKLCFQVRPHLGIVCHPRSSHSLHYRVWQMYDADNSGYVSREEMHNMLKVTHSHHISTLRAFRGETCLRKTVCFKIHFYIFLS